MSSRLVVDLVTVSFFLFARRVRANTLDGLGARREGGRAFKGGSYLPHTFAPEVTALGLVGRDTDCNRRFVTVRH
eukprot:m.130936 g.130936  ORF g.130936 m.130936 type:complete len:75 (-) comp11298_c0_seq1:111-335(-)